MGSQLFLSNANNSRLPYLYLSPLFNLVIDRTIHSRLHKVDALQEELHI